MAFAVQGRRSDRDSRLLRLLLEAPFCLPFEGVGCEVALMGLEGSKAQEWEKQGHAKTSGKSFGVGAQCV